MIFRNERKNKPLFKTNQDSRLRRNDGELLIEFWVLQRFKAASPPPFFRHKKNYLNPTPLVSSPAIPYHATFIYPPNQKEKPCPSKPCNKPPKPAAPFTF